MQRMEKIFAESGDAAEYARKYFARLGETIAAVDPAGVAEAAGVLEQAIEEKRTLFLMANGGSASVASHFVNDCQAGMRQEGKPTLRAVALTDNVPTLTAVANDTDFDSVFLIQLEALLRPGDLVLAMSVSGNSPNLVRALEFAREQGATTMAWCGMQGGRLAELADHAIHMPSDRDEYGPIEDMFSVLMHAVLTYLTQKRGKKLYH
jgi:D-sedoheptulose 7-phosphate isomerase